MNGSRHRAHLIVVLVTPIHRSLLNQADSMVALLVPAVLTSLGLLTSRTISGTDWLLSDTDCLNPVI